MARVALVSQCLKEGDAVSHDVLGMHQSLVARGHEVAIFAIHWQKDMLAIRPFSQIQRWSKDPNTVLIYHHATGWDGAMEVMRQAHCKRIVRYHNVTPPEFFDGLDHDYVRVCRLGRAQLASLAHMPCHRYLSASPYNMRELLQQGASPSASVVVPPFHVIAGLQALEADLTVLDRYRDGRTNLLMVGRLAPNKGHRALLDAFAVYHHAYNHQSRLLIVGSEDERLAIYGRALRLQVQELGLEGAVVFTGPVSSRALKALYLAADVFVITSRHEGFCVPLVEAMALGVPIVALGCAAIPDTLGEAALVWDEADPDLLAESIHQIVTDDRARAMLGELGGRRYRKHFTIERIREQFLQAMEGLL